MLWQKARALRSRPSELLDIGLSNYEAYCLDEAVVFFGLQLENMLDNAGVKPDKESVKIERARQKVLDDVFGKDEKSKSSGFADPALMFK
jgi:hypothetical protein